MVMSDVFLVTRLANVFIMAMAVTVVLEVEGDTYLFDSNRIDDIPSSEESADEFKENDMAFLDINDTLSSLNPSSDYINILQFDNLNYNESDIENKIYNGNSNLRNIRDVSEYTNDTIRNLNWPPSYSLLELNITSTTSKNEEENMLQDLSHLIEDRDITLLNTISVFPTMDNTTQKNVQYNLNKTKSEINSYPPKKSFNKLKIGYYVQNQSAQSEEKQKPFNKAIGQVYNTTILDSTNFTTENYFNSNITQTTNGDLSQSDVYKTGNNISESSRRTMLQEESVSALKIVLIVTVCIVVVSVIMGIGMLSMVLYRRYYWNKPQTLSDKCSNADSSGYIDDSTMKENSEEMYSLDNDSFLNSLEAMTIQNYWADSIKHTKL